MKKILFFFLMITSQLAYADFEVSHCYAEGFILENVGFMHSITMNSQLTVHQLAPLRYRVSHKLSSDFLMRASLTTEENTFTMQVNIYKNNQLFASRLARAHLAQQKVKTYYSTTFKFSDIYSARPAREDSELISFKLRCLVQNDSYWPW